MEFTTLSEVEAYSAYQIHKQAQINPWNNSTFCSCLTPPYFAWKIEEAHMVLGYYIGLQVLNEVTLMDIAIHKAHRGTGLGRQLMQHFVTESLNKNAEILWLEVRESNTSAINLYSSFNFHLIETRKNYYKTADGKEHALIMRARLT